MVPPWKQLWFPTARELSAFLLFCLLKLVIDTLHGFVYQLLNLYLGDMLGEDFLLLL